MAVLDNVSIPNVNLFNFLGTYKKALDKKWNQYKMYRRTMKELSVLSDRELDDIGLSRYNIRTLTHKTCFKK